MTRRWHLSQLGAVLGGWNIVLFVATILFLALPARAQFKRGEVIVSFGGDRYQVESHLGKGGYGSVYLAIPLAAEGAVETFDKAPVAIKIVTGWNKIKGERQGVSAVSRVASSRPHNNLVKVFQETSFARQGYVKRRSQRWLGLVMEPALVSVDVVSTQFFLDPGNPVAAAEAVGRTHAIYRSMLAAIEDLAANRLVHNDIKPANIFVFDGANHRSLGPPIEISGTRKSWVAKLGDYGIVAMKGAPLVVGSPGYNDPEKAKPGYRTHPLSDIYSLAVTLHELLMGKRLENNAQDWVGGEDKFSSSVKEIKADQNYRNSIHDLMAAGEKANLGPEAKKQFNELSMFILGGLKSSMENRRSFFGESNPYLLRIDGRGDGRLVDPKILTKRTNFADWLCRLLAGGL